MSDAPLHQMTMRNMDRDNSAWARKVNAWVEQNGALRSSLLAALNERGPLRSCDFEASAAVGWQSSGWSHGRDISRMLDFLWLRGQIQVARRAGSARWCDATERLFPHWAQLDPLAEREAVRLAAQKSLRALGVATERDISRHFTRGRYPGLTAALAELEATGSIVRVSIHEDGVELPGRWFMPTEMHPMLEQLSTAWEPRTILLSPFDNLICDRDRTERLFGFSYQSEIYTPQVKRRFGYYVMPILCGDRLIGRIDPLMDRVHIKLIIHSVHLEEGTHADGVSGPAVVHAIEELALFLGATTITYTQAPAGLRHLL